MLTYGSYENGTVNPLSDVDLYFIPKSDRAYELCKTFIVEGIGYDLFPMSWERVEGLAEFNECLTPCLANVKILYCNSEVDKLRFYKLQNRLKENLSNKDFMLDIAMKQMDEAMKHYQSMLFEESICKIRTIAGFIVMSLSDAVAYANQTYFSCGLKKQLEDLKNMKRLPENYIFLYEGVTKAKSELELKECCYQIIKNTKKFLSSMVIQGDFEEKKANYKELAGIYEEIISTWNKIKVCCDSGNATLAYISGVCLQNELDNAAIENGLKKFDLLTYYNEKDLKLFNEKAIEIQEEFVKIIEENGASIRQYNTVEEFIKQN